jgi:hypothetical protein
VFTTFFNPNSLNRVGRPVVCLAFQCSGQLCRVTSTQAASMSGGSPVCSRNLHIGPVPYLLLLPFCAPLPFFCCCLCHLLQAASMSGGSPVCSRNLPPATVEQLEAFFQGQLAQVGVRVHLWT